MNCNNILSLKKTLILHGGEYEQLKLQKSTINQMGLKALDKSFDSKKCIARRISWAKFNWKPCQQNVI